MYNRILFSFALLATSFGFSEAAWDFFSAAQSAEHEKNWKGVVHNCHVVVTTYENSPFAPEALFMMGVAYFEMGENELANECFSDYLKKQTTPEEFEQAIRYKFEIARRFEDGAKMHMMGWKHMPKWMPAKELAIEIYDEVVATLPRHELASEGLYRKAHLLYELKDYKLAIDAYQALIRRFPKHARAPDSYLGIGKVYIKQCEEEFKDPQYLDQAEINLRKFRADFPAEDRLVNAEQMLLEMKEKYAADLFETGQFFERTKKAQAATLYYYNIVNRYPGTEAAKKSEMRLSKLNYSNPQLSS
ncbi:MAG: outer membrane protein assembly factor BamD [Chlamydiia bacterium]|nr:outer membrane protein assembly factor BamD [Chlamydiia bacterium]